MSKLKKAFALIKAGDFKTFFRKISVILRKYLYRIRARIEDWRIGRISINKRIPSKFIEKGSYATESTDYRWLDKIFRSLPLSEDAVFVDVGCGEGRVLTYLYLRGFRSSLIGVELDSDVANTAKARTAKCQNIEVHCANILESREIIAKANVFFLANPFNEEIFVQFIQKVEEYCDHPVRLYYCHDLYRRQLDKRENWYILRRDAMIVPGVPSRYYTVYKFIPEEGSQQAER